MSTQLTQDIVSHEELNRTFSQATNPQEIITLGDRLGMMFSLEKAKEIAQRHKIFLSMQ